MNADCLTTGSPKNYLNSSRFLHFWDSFVINTALVRSDTKTQEYSLVYTDGLCVCKRNLIKYLSKDWRLWKSLLLTKIGNLVTSDGHVIEVEKNANQFLNVENNF